MATYEEIEAERDWLIDNCAEFLKRLELLNGEEPTQVKKEIVTAGENAHHNMCVVIGGLNELLILKKKDEWTPDDD